MYEIAVVDKFVGMHALPDEAPHRHEFKIEVVVLGERLGEGNILVDFRELKASLRAVLAPLEGKNLLELPFWEGGVPSTEAIARFVYRGLERCAWDRPLTLSRVTVWESEGARVSYYE